ncbi:MAG: dTDP-glucose 4,6-dehydratase [Rhodothermales bacterium]|nr:dTDP-glucose 4,6-dehydratase [Rhodothermales bacterium]
MRQTNTTHRPERVLVTGGAGFIGSNLLLHLVPRHPEVVFVNLDKLTYAGNLANLRAIETAPNYHFVQGDIGDLEALHALFDEHRFTTVIHLAAESHVDRSILDPLAFARTNVMGTMALLEAARRHWTDGGDYRFYHVSTDEVFGSLGDEGSFSETTPYDPRSPYSASKAASDHFVRAYHHTYRLPVVLSNCSNNYGPYQFPEKLIPLFILNALHGKPVPVYGQGKNVRDWLYVEDHAEAIETILLHGETGATYAIGGDSERPNIELVRLLLDLVDELTGSPAGTSQRLITYVTDRAGHDFRYAMDHARLTEALGWKPRHTLETGLRRTVDWYLANQDWLAAVVDKSYLEYYTRQYHGR